MPPYANLDEFTQLARNANSDYSHRSSLAPLITVLGKSTWKRSEVNREVDRLSHTPSKHYVTKANKYKDALYFLRATCPGVGAVRVLPDTESAFAVFYWKTSKLPEADLSHAYPQAVAVKPAYTKVDGTVEEYVLNHHDSLGVVIIHATSAPAASKERSWWGWSALSHMQSVLRVAKRCGVKICVLHLPQSQPSCELYDGLGKDYLPVVSPEHSGFADPAFDAFVDQYACLVVMGYDADVCVYGNMFGSVNTSEVNPDRIAARDVPVRPGLVNRACVVTSRPLLLTGGNSIDGFKSSYGPLAGA